MKRVQRKTYDARELIMMRFGQSEEDSDLVNRHWCKLLPAIHLHNQLMNPQLMSDLQEIIDSYTCVRGKSLFFSMVYEGTSITSTKVQVQYEYKMLINPIHREQYDCPKMSPIVFTDILLLYPP